VICHMGQKCLDVTGSCGTDAPGSDNRVDTGAESKELAGYMLWLLVVTQMWSGNNEALGSVAVETKMEANILSFFLFFVFFYIHPNNTIKLAASALNGTWLCAIRRDWH
jgi:hypothetical protein